jgi:hypothetical protein
MVCCKINSVIFFLTDDLRWIDNQAGVGASSGDL